jgi:hypothetical protein
MSMTTPRMEIKQLFELAKDIRELAQSQYAEGKRDEALEAVSYAEGIERAIVEIAALHGIEPNEMEVLRSLELNDPRARFTSTPHMGQQPGRTAEGSNASTRPPAPISRNRPLRVR